MIKILLKGSSFLVEFFRLIENSCKSSATVVATYWKDEKTINKIARKLLRKCECFRCPENKFLSCCFWFVFKMILSCMLVSWFFYCTIGYNSWMYTMYTIHVYNVYYTCILHMYAYMQTNSPKCLFQHLWKQQRKMSNFLQANILFDWKYLEKCIIMINMAGDELLLLLSENFIFPLRLYWEHLFSLMIQQTLTREATDILNASILNAPPSFEHHLLLLLFLYSFNCFSLISVIRFLCWICVLLAFFQLLKIYLLLVLDFHISPVHRCWFLMSEYSVISLLCLHLHRCTSALESSPDPAAWSFSVSNSLKLGLHNVRSFTRSKHWMQLLPALKCLVLPLFWWDSISCTYLGESELSQSLSNSESDTE